MATPSEPTARGDVRGDDLDDAALASATHTLRGAAREQADDSAPRAGASMAATMPGTDGPSESMVDATRDPNAGIGPGVVIGRYVVVSRIGAGGMGVVFAAYDPELDRKVAIKVLLAGSSGPERTSTSTSTSVALGEAQALAKLAHPNVVAVHDVGTTALGRVWLAMEFVGGRTLTQWLRARPRSWRDVLDVVRHAGVGLAAAHAAGLVHHDVKPDNVMIDEDDRGHVDRVRVMDFGLAHRDGGTTEASGASPRREVAAAEAPVPGTPAYMAPEQWRGDATDARTDQFSFCAMVWEAVHRQRAFAGDHAAAIASAVLAGEVQPPPARPDVPRWLRLVLRRGLEVDRSRRHPSMRALLDAMDRGRVAARRRTAAAAVLVVAAVIGGGLGVRAWQRAKVAERCAEAGDEIRTVWNAEIEGKLREAFHRDGVAADEDAAARVVPWLSRHTDAWATVATEVCIANRTERTLDDDLHARARWCLDELRADLDDTISQFLRGSIRARRAAIRTAAALGDAEHCRDPRVLARTPAPAPDQVDEVLEIRALLGETRALFAALDRDGAIARIDEAAVRALALGWAPLTAKVQLRRASLLEEFGRFDEAESEAVEAYFTAATGAVDSVAFAAADWLAFIIGVRLGRPVEGLRWSRQAELLLPPDDPKSTQRADHLSTRGNIELQRGRAAEAAALHHASFEIRGQVLGPDHPSTASSLNNVANAVYQSGDSVRATALYEDACARLERALGSQSPDLGVCLVNLATVVSSSDRERAIAVYHRAIANFEAALGEQHPNVASARANLGLALMGAEQLLESRAELERALEIYARALGDQHPQLAAPLEGLAAAAYRQRDYPAAIAFGERLVALLERSPADTGGKHGNTLLARFTLARARAAAGGDAAAVRDAAATLRDWLNTDEGRADRRRDDSLAEAERWLAATPPAPGQ